MVFLVRYGTYEFPFDELVHDSVASDCGNTFDLVGRKIVRFSNFITKIATFLDLQNFIKQVIFL